MKRSASSSIKNVKSIIRRLQARNPRPSADQIGLATEALKHPECFVRRVALEALTRMQAPRLSPILIDALSDRCWEVRVAAVEGLGRTLVVPQDRTRQLTKLLSDSSKLVRTEAAQALGTIGDRKALPRLRAALIDDSPLVRRYIAEAIGRLGTLKDRAILSAVLKTERSTCAKVGLWHGLYLLGARDVLPNLISLLNSANYIIRSATALALEDTSRYPSDARQTERAIHKALKSESTPARENMQTTLSRLRKANRNAHRAIV